MKSTNLKTDYFHLMITREYNTIKIDIECSWESYLWLEKIHVSENKDWTLGYVEILLAYRSYKLSALNIPILLNEAASSPKNLTTKCCYGCCFTDFMQFWAIYVWFGITNLI